MSQSAILGCGRIAQTCLVCKPLSAVYACWEHESVGLNVVHGFPLLWHMLLSVSQPCRHGAVSSRAHGGHQSVPHPVQAYRSSRLASR